MAPTGTVTSNEDIEILRIPAASGGLRRKAQMLGTYVQVATEIAHADILHWYYGGVFDNRYDLYFARALQKPSIVEFCGSDIRIATMDAAVNPFFARVIDTYEYRDEETYAKSRLRQEAFASSGAAVLVSCKSLVPYVQRDLFPTVHFVRQRIDLRKYEAVLPDPRSRRPLVVHATTAPIVKGTPHVLDSVRQLKQHYEFDFERVQGMQHSQAMKLMRSCDIYVDQVIHGAHGQAAIEAMALGKPVVCYIRPDLVGQYPPELPLVSASPDTLCEVLSNLLDNGDLRRKLGEQGRAYVEKYHDSRLLAQELINIYRQL